MKRREFITLLGGAAATWPLSAHAQQPERVRRVGFLHSASPDTAVDRVRALRQGLSETGFVEGRNVAIEYGWAEDQNDKLPTLAADLVRRQAMVIVATGNLAAAAAKAATTTIPIVFSTASDPVALGLVASLNRPGGNLTGVSSLNDEVGPKRLELLHELAPTATAIALLVNPTNPAVERQSLDFQAAARTLQLQLHVLHASTERDIDTAFATLIQRRAGALVIGTDVFFNDRIEQLAALAFRHGVPAIYSLREFAAAGGLMSYGASRTDAYRLVGVYVGRILKGEKPADLPVVQPTKFELVVNVKTAKAIGLTIPESFLARADEVIE